MGYKRVAFLATALIVFNCIAFYVISRPHEEKVSPLSSISPQITQEADLEKLVTRYFVPVTNHANVLIDDVTEATSEVWVMGDFANTLTMAINAANIPVTFTEGDAKFFQDNMENPGEKVLLIPLSGVSPNHRVLKVNGVSIFDSSEDWPLTAEVSAGSDKEITPDLISELVFGGTVVLSRGVAERIDKYSDAYFPWAEIASVLKPADFSFINFKGSITSDCVYDGYTLTFCGRPDYLTGMAEAGVDGVSVSGNHIGDYGQVGMAETVKYLEEYGFAHTGLGSNYTDAIEPIRVTLGDTTVGILAYNNVPGTAPCAGSAEKWGVTCMTEQTVHEEISLLAEEVDVVVVYPNWGPEYIHTPHDEAQIQWSKVFIEAGADIVLGDQAHWVQTMEIYNDVPIYYGLGNIVFDQMWSDKTTEGLLVKVFVVNGKVLTTEPIATKIYDYAQPRIEQGSVRDTILSYLTLPVD